MKKIIYITIILVFSCTVIIAQAQDAKIIIKTNKSDTRIIVNDKFIGSGSHELNVNPGRYIVKVRENQLKWSAQFFIDTVFVTDSLSVINLKYIFDQKLYLDSKPQDSYVLSGDSVLGNTPLFISPKINSLTLTKRNYESRLLNVNELKNNNPVELKYLGEDKHEKFINSDWFIILVSSAVYFGATAAYLKLQADKKYQEYVDNRSSASFDATKVYDISSGVAFGLLQVNLGVLIYLLLND